MSWSFIAHLPWDQLGGLSAVVAFVFGGLGRLWRSIKKLENERDKKRAEQLTAIQSSNKEMYDNHEKLDQQRHADNTAAIGSMQRELVSIGKALAALGWRNGSGHVAGEFDSD